MPPWTAAIDATMARPRPKPSWDVRSLSRSNGWKIRAASAALSEMPAALAMFAMLARAALRPSGTPHVDHFRLGRRSGRRLDHGGRNLRSDHQIGDRLAGLRGWLIRRRRHRVARVSLFKYGRLEVRRRIDSGVGRD